MVSESAGGKREREREGNKGEKLTNGLLSEIDGFDVRRLVRLSCLHFIFIFYFSFRFMDDDDDCERVPEA